VSNPQQTNAAALQGHGSFGYIFQPLERRQILATVEVALLRKQLEKQLKESRQWLATVLNSMGPA